MGTLKEHFDSSKKNIVVRLIYDEWENPGSTNRTQRQIDNIPVDKLVKEYGDWRYDGAYTTQNTKECIKIDVWATATDERKYSEEYRSKQENFQEEYER